MKFDNDYSFKPIKTSKQGIINTTIKQEQYNDQVGDIFPYQNTKN